MSDFDEDALQDIYTWIDDIPLSRPKKNIARDFSDGVLVAEIIHHFLPKMVDLHNYIGASSSTQKLDNWNLLSRKCFSKLYFNPAEEHIKGVVACKAGYIELVLNELRNHIETYMARRKAASLVEKNKIHDQFSGSPHSLENSDRGSHTSSRESSKTRMFMPLDMNAVEEKPSYAQIQQNIKDQISKQSPNPNLNMSRVKKKPPSPRPKQASFSRPKQSPSPRPKQAPSPRLKQAPSPRPKQAPAPKPTDIPSSISNQGFPSESQLPPSEKNDSSDISLKGLIESVPSQALSDTPQTDLLGTPQKVNQFEKNIDSGTDKDMSNDHSMSIKINHVNSKSKSNGHIINKSNSSVESKPNHMNYDAKIKIDRNSKRNNQGAHARKESLKEKKALLNMPNKEKKQPAFSATNTQDNNSTKFQSKPMDWHVKPDSVLNSKPESEESTPQVQLNKLVANKFATAPEEPVRHQNVDITSKFLKEYLKNESTLRTNTSGTYVVGSLSPPETPNKKIALSGRINETSIKVDSPVVEENQSFLDNKKDHGEIGEKASAMEGSGIKFENDSGNKSAYELTQGPYSYPAYMDPSYHNTQPHGVNQEMQQGQPNQYQFQSQPHVVAGIHKNIPGTFDVQPHPPPPSSIDTSPKHVSGMQRKPITNANKSKAKTTVKPVKAVNGGSNENGDVAVLRLQLEEKEQALLSSQETVQILNAKIRRLEHLLHLKDMRITELKGSSAQQLDESRNGSMQQQQQAPVNSVQPYFTPGNQQSTIRAPIINAGQPHFQMAPHRFPSSQQTQYVNPQVSNAANKNAAPQYNYATGKLNYHAPLPDIPKSPPTYEYHAR